jgi:hypothetical protein
MFLQLATNPIPATTESNARKLFTFHPLVISGLIETGWRNRYTGPAFPFDPWPKLMTDRIWADFSLPLNAGFTFGTTNWDHAIYAYLIENTRIYDIFRKVIETYQFSETLEVPSIESQRFWRNTEFLIYSDPELSMVWNMTSRTRGDEVAHRMTFYSWFFGLDLTHAAEIVQKHPYQKPAAANRDFIPTVEAFLREVWRGIVNSSNTSGSNPTDDEAIATTARRVYDMLITRRRNGNLSREEFRAVALMSWLHLTISFDSPVVQDLKASASSPEERLAKIGERVGMKPHSKSKAFLDLAQPFSFLLQAIETGKFNDPAFAPLLYQPGTITRNKVQIVIDQYTLATGRDLKSAPVTLTQQAFTPAKVRA